VQQFCDSQGHPWKIEITIGAVKRVKSLVGVDLLQPVPMTEKDRDEDEQPLLTQLEMDPVLLTDVLFAIVQPQAKAKKITDVDFGTSMTAETFKTAAEGFWVEYQDFFHQLGRKPVAAMIQSQRELAKEAFQSEEINELIDARIKEAKEGASEKIKQGLKALKSGN